MPGRRPDKKGSFGGHLDELVRVFETEPARQTDRPEKRTPNGDNVHDRLFEGAWRKARDHESGFSNQ